MTQIHDIRKRYYEEGKSITQIASETGLDRKTVRKYVNKDDWNEPVATMEKDEVQFPSLNTHKPLITKWLEDDKKAKRKQRHTAKRVYTRLVALYGAGKIPSYRTIAGYVAMEKKRIWKLQVKAALPLEHIPGEAQVDFGAADFYENGSLVEGNYLNIDFPYSNQGYLQVFKGENQQCLFEGLLAIFRHIGGVPTRIWFDNASTMVTQILKGGRRNLTDAFMRFQEHYRFEAVFCNANAGEEKGGVESKVGYHRRNLLVPIPEVRDLRSFNKRMLAECDQDGLREHYRKHVDIKTLHEEDRKVLLPLPAVDLDVSLYLSVRTDAYGKFTLENGCHTYSSSPKYALSKVLVRITANEVEVMDESHRVFVKHQRLYGKKHQESMQWLPYLNQLARKPGALKYTGIYHMFPKDLKAYLNQCSKSDQGTLLKAIAELTGRSSFESACKTVETALVHQAFDPDSLLVLFERIHGTNYELPPLGLQESIPSLIPIQADLTALDKALRPGDGARRC